MYVRNYEVWHGCYTTRYWFYGANEREFPNMCYPILNNMSIAGISTSGAYNIPRYVGNVPSTNTYSTSGNNIARRSFSITLYLYEPGTNWVELNEGGYYSGGFHTYTANVTIIYSLSSGISVSGVNSNTVSDRGTTSYFVTSDYRFYNLNNNYINYNGTEINNILNKYK